MFSYHFHSTSLSDEPPLRIFLAWVSCQSFAWALLLALLISIAGWAQKSNPVVDAHAMMATDAAHADAPIKIAVLAQVASGYHINDHKPTLDYLIPTAFKMEPSEQFALKSVVYPKGTLKKFPFSDVPLSVYEGSVDVGLLLQAGKGGPPYPAGDRNAA